jgi:hypothetical protein
MHIPLREASVPQAQSSNPARLNPFQKLARQWDILHPYNGIQILRACGTLDPRAANCAWRQSLTHLGLGAVQVAQNRYAYSTAPPDDPDLEVTFCPPGTTIDHWATAAMNQPFPLTGHVPFRAVVIQQQSDFWMGLCYHHWVADSVSIRMLLRDWFVRLFDPGARTAPCPRIGLSGAFSILDPQRELWAAGGALLNSLRWQSQLRRTRRIEDPKAFADLSQRCLIVKTPAGLINALRQKSNAMGVTVNDVFLAAIAETCDRFVPAPARFRRTKLAIGTIVDLRPSLPDARGNVFDLLLGFTNISCDPCDLKDFNSLLRAVSFQTRQNKSAALPQASWIRMMTGVLAGKILTPESQINFYRKRASLAGANSNVNMNRCWAARYSPDLIQQYLRIAPTGPMTPIVFATTTLGRELALAITHRAGILSDEVAASAAQMFVEVLEKIC